MTELEKLMMYGFPRGIGHTWAEINGVKNNPEAILIVVNEMHATLTGLPPAQTLTLINLQEKLVGRQCPIVIDHAALDVLVKWCVGHYQQKIELLEHKIERVKKALVAS